MGSLDGFSHRVCDDRGVPFKPCSALVARAEYRAPGTSALGIVLAVVLMFTSPFWHPTIQQLTNRVGLGDFAALLISIVIVFSGMPWTVLRLIAAKHTGFQRAIADRKALARCPGCDYELDKLHADNDGITTCPECGCAWRLMPYDAITLAATSSSGQQGPGPPG